MKTRVKLLISLKAIHSTIKKEKKKMPHAMKEMCFMLSEQKTSGQ